MLNIVRAAALLICISAFSVSSASATTYNYVGNPLDVVVPCCSTGGGGFFNGSVTFDFNTLAFSGTIYVNSERVTAFQLAGQDAGYFPFGHFVLDNGAIASWSLTTIEYGASSFSAGGIGGDYYSTGVYCGSPLCYLAYTQDPGVWTLVDPSAPVPGPIVGAGLPGLVMAVAGFIGWRRSRRAAL